MKSKNNIDELRGHLFDTLRGLKDGSITVETAQAMSLVGKTIIDTAKVEIEFTKVTGETVASKFLEQEQSILPKGITAIRKHKMIG